MGYLKKIKVNTETAEHVFEICGECGNEIDNSLVGFFGHSSLPSLILCEGCYQAIVSKGDWQADKVKVKGIWLS